MLSTSGQIIAAVPTAAVAPVSRYKKSRRVPASPAPSGPVAAMSAITRCPDFSPKPSETGRNVEEPRRARKPADAKVAPPDRAGLQVALYQPDIAANAGAALRLAACLAVPLLVIEPCGFVWDDRRLRRAGLDYLAQAALTRFAGWTAFDAWRRAEGKRLILLTTRGSEDYHALAYRPGDVLLAGRESMGVPDEVHAGADLRVRIPLAPGRRALNVVTALAMVLGEALRQTGGFP
jgi:tRNA (cytidine/uridine-2'-O-)-methyltransferase